MYCDGSGTSGGAAGIGYVAVVDGVVQCGSLQLRNATNQQAEILAAAYALHQLPPGDWVVRSDSEYVCKGYHEWLPYWRANGYVKRSGGLAKNRAHWERLAQAAARHSSVVFEWVPGHAGVPGNERAHELASAARAAALAHAT